MKRKKRDEYPPLELMWVAPTIVGAAQEEEPPVTLHKVLPPGEK